MENCGVAAYDESKHKGVVRHVCVRSNHKNEILVCLVVNANKVEKLDILVSSLREHVPTLTGLVLNINTRKTNVIYGEKFKAI